MRSLLIIILFVGVTSAGALDHGYRYDYESGLCLNSSNKMGQNTGNLDECGEESEVVMKRERRHLETHGNMSHRGLKIRASALPTLDLSKGDLVGAEFESVNLRAANLADANLSRAKFKKVDLSKTNFRNADLRGATFDEVDIEEANFEKAIYDDRTKLPFDCKLAAQRNMIFVSPRTHYCSDKKIQNFSLSDAFKKSHPDISTLLTPEGVDVYSDIGFSIRPLDIKKVADEEYGLTDKNYYEILCALKLSMCDFNPRAMREMYKFKRIPKPVLSEGIELYHANTRESERAKKIRWVGFFEIFQKEPLELKSILSKINLEMKAKNPQFKGPIRFRSQIQDIQNLKVDFNFLPELTTSGCALVREKDVQRIKCRVQFETGAPESPDIGWLQQVMNALIRRAFGFTLTLKAETFEELKDTSKGGFQTVIPVLYVNTQAIEWQLLKHFDPRSRI